MKTIQTPNAPTPAGHYAQAIEHAGLIYVSGQLPIDAGTGKPVLGSIEDQTTLALKNVAAILEAAGSSLSRVLRCTVYVSDISHWPKVNDAYARMFRPHQPARAVVPTKELHYGCAIEIDAIAATGSGP